MTGAGPDDRPIDVRPGAILGSKYRVERELARGGMGVVVIATHLKLERPVAIKLLAVRESDRAYVAARFLREARAAARLGGDHVVRIIDLDQTPDGTPYLVMELLDGVDLELALKDEGPAAPGRVVDWALQACAALAEAHARGIVHRDVKPSNLLRVKRVDGSELIKLVDFGISKMIDDQVQLTRTATALGSPLFMSPEQLLNPKVVDPRSDLWSLGVTLFRLLSGKSPFEAADAASMAALIAATPPAPLAQAAPGLPEGLCEVVMRCLEKDPARRWPDVVALAEALEPFRGPGALGSAASVRFSRAQAQASQAAQAEAPAPLAPVPGARDGWTLSHDVPRTTPAPAGPDARGTPGPSQPTALPPAVAAPAAAPAAPRRQVPWAAVLVGAAVLAGGAWAVVGSAPGKAPGPAATPAPVEPVAVSSPVVAVPPAEVAVAAPSLDAGASPRPRPPRQAAHASEKDPSELELK